MDKSSLSFPHFNRVWSFWREICFILCALLLFAGDALISGMYGTPPRAGVFGGPVAAAPIPAGHYAGLPLLYAVSSPAEKADVAAEDAARLALSPSFALFSNKGAVLGGALSENQEGLLTYIVEEGDTLSHVAAQFGISLNTVLWANPSVKGVIQPGQELTILPTSGVLYKVQSGDTAESIAAAFGTEFERFTRVNKIENPDLLAAGVTVIVPDGRPLRSLASLVASAVGARLPDLGSFFSLPVPSNSWNWGVLHANNAIDFANVCGTSIYAAADGFATEVGSPTRWNAGYGGFIELEHANGTKTLYAHTRTNLIGVGDFVSKGDPVAYVGATGYVHGRTGCHLHFEVSGARNPFVK